jgi:hypothetical protein
MDAENKRFRPEATEKPGLGPHVGVPGETGGPDDGTSAPPRTTLFHDGS